MNRICQAPTNFPPHVCYHLLMHRLQLVWPIFCSKSSENSWEIVGTMKSCVVIYLGDGLGFLSYASHAQKVIQELWAWLHLVKREDERPKVLECCHFYPLRRIGRKLVKQLQDLTTFNFFTRNFGNFWQDFNACFPDAPYLILTQFPENRYDHSDEYLFSQYL